MQRTFTISVCCVSALILSAPVHAKRLVDCNRGESLASAVARADDADTIVFTGTCNGPILIDRDRITLQGQGAAVIDGRQQNAVTVRGAQNVKLTNLEVRNGLMGILLESQANAALENIVTHENAVSGLDIENTSSATLRGQFTSEDNRVFGINVNAGSSLTISRAQVLLQRNVLGIQLGTGASAFLTDANAVITAANNFSTGLTVVSGSHLVSFSGMITAHDNGRNGVSVNSKAGLDLDAASILESYRNGGHGVQLAESSVMTLFNTAGFSGVPGNTTIKSHDNAGNGVAILLGSNLTMVNQVVMETQNNVGNGVQVDNGSSATLLNASVSGNHPDVSLAFGARSDIRRSSVGTMTCDATVLSRGDVVCPAP